MDENRGEEQDLIKGYWIEGGEGLLVLDLHVKD